MKTTKKTLSKSAQKTTLLSIKHHMDRENIEPVHTGYSAYSASEFSEALPLRCSSGTYDTFEELEECLNIQTY